MNISAYRKQLVEIGQRMYARGFVAANDGNLSVRLDDRRILITPTGVSKGFMQVEDMVIMDLDGKVISHNGRPSSEAMMHVDIYLQRPDVRSVCHAHPPYATAFAVAGLAMDACVMPEVIFTLGSVPLAEYATPGTEEVYLSLRPHIRQYDAVLLANHGVVTVGQTIEHAYFKMETVEHAAKIHVIAQQLGGVKPLSAAQVERLLEMRKNAGISATASCKADE